ncbi:LytR/AlgR family response regulator transcription factor [Aquimarina agarivorans]|uniref:LytR/AlgR family response regulator transcription factor n=1 Tax=Aquimarina agarivorans TaxID=980584 RepID=UPI000494E5CA|nr:LytTR family transcriptional regulator DNA-binding domain-containing protein [Aquimarina agarivorans]
MTHENSKIKILVVEDEVLLAQDIIQRLTDMNYEVVGFAMTASSALELIEENPSIDILLMDIMIKGTKDGIQLAEVVKEKYDIPFIFLTSNADKEIVERAKKVQPYAYMLKPFNDRQVQIAIELALMNFSKKSPQQELLKEQHFDAEDNQVLHIKNCLFLKKNNKFKRVSIEEILYVQADNNYSNVITAHDKFIYSIVMKKIVEQLPKKLFLRTHRSFIVNINCIDGYEGNMLFVKGFKIPISKSYRESVFKLFPTI